MTDKQVLPADVIAVADLIQEHACDPTGVKATRIAEYIAARVAEVKDEAWHEAADYLSQQYDAKKPQMDLPDPFDQGYLSGLDFAQSVLSDLAGPVRGDKSGGPEAPEQACSCDWWSGAICADCEDRQARSLADLIWTASRRDEGTISAIGANTVAREIIARGWRPREDRIRRDIREILGYSCETQAPNRTPTTEYMTDRWAKPRVEALVQYVLKVREEA